MPEYTPMRFGANTLADLDALAASAGSRTQAAREAVAYWRHIVEEAGRRNAADLSREDWELLAHLNRPDMPSDYRGEDERTAVRDWSKALAVELCAAWEGRAAVLPCHQEEAKACRALARRIGSWGVVRGYALFACLRHFWARPDTPEGWWRPEVWMNLAQ